MRDRTDHILTECGGLVGDVAQDLAEKGQGPEAPNEPEKDPEEDPEEDHVEESAKSGK